MQYGGMGETPVPFSSGETTISAFKKRAAILSVPLAVIALSTVTAAPSHAALCDPGFVYGVSVNGSKVCVPLTDEVVEIITITEPSDDPTPDPSTSTSASPTKEPKPEPSPETGKTSEPEKADKAPANPVPPASEAAQAEYVNSDNGNIVAVNTTGNYVDTVEKVAIRPHVVVPVAALQPDPVVMEEVKERAQELAITPVSPTATATATPSLSASPETSSSASSEPQAATAAQAADEAGMPFGLWVLGIFLALLGLAAIYYAYTSIMKSRNPRHGRRRATN